MKAISLWQPWASLVAKGAKKIETRSWRPPDHLIGTGEWIAIHATQRTPPHSLNQAWGNRHIVDALAQQGVTRFNVTGGPGSLPACAIVAVAQIRDVMPAEELLNLWLSHRVRETWNWHEEREHAFGDYRPGRFAWRLANVIDLNSCPVQNVVGHQRVWPVDGIHELRLRATVADLETRLAAKDPSHPVRRFLAA